MTKISNTTAYPQLTPLTLADYYPITSAATSGKVTKTTTLQEVQTLLFAGLSPEIGGTLKITPITYNGVLTSPAAVANALDPIVVVNRYEIVIFSVNGDKYILKLQDLILGVGEADIADSDFITLSGYTKLGTGTNVLKGFNTSTGKQEFYALKSTGLDISIVSGDIVVESKAGSNLGASGQIIYKGLNATTKIHEFYKIDSNDFVISLTDNIVSINNPVVIDTPRFYVNSGYDIGGTAPENGSPSRPYKAIQSAVTAFIGTGDDQDPQFKGSEIIIQKGIGYNYTGNFVLNGATIILEEGAEIISDPLVGTYLCDYDDLLNNEPAYINIIVNEGSLITLKKSGFKNAGTAIITSSFVNSKYINISGNGVIYQETNNVVSTPYVIIESNYTNQTSYGNDGASTFNISNVRLQTATQATLRVGGDSTVIFENADLAMNTVTYAVNANLKSIDLVGGYTRMLNCNLNFLQARTNGFSLDKDSAFPCNLYLRNCSLDGTVTNLFANIDATNKASIDSANTTTTFFICTNIFNSSVLWNTLTFRYNNIGAGTFNPALIDLTAGNTISVSNIFAQYLVDSMCIYSSRADAVSTGALYKGAKFINRKTVNAVDLVAGVEYQVLTSGSPSLGTVGSYFTATGSETGTGTAYGYVTDILI
jgi:hypothetical protein